MYTRLNHVNVSLSYNATLAAVTEVSKLHKVPLQQWIAEGVTFKFVGNVDKMKGVRVEHQAELQHMYSMLVVRSRVLSPPSDAISSIGSFGSLLPSAFLPTVHDIRASLGEPNSLAKHESPLIHFKGSASTYHPPIPCGDG